MPNLVELYQYKADKHADAIPLYYKEYQKGGSFKEEVLNVKTQNAEKDYALLCAWYQKVFEKMSGELAKAGSDKEAQAVQTKMLAYNHIFQENTVQIFREDCARKNPDNKAFVPFTAPKEIRDWNNKTRATFKVYELGTGSFSKEVDKNIADRYEEIQAKKEADKKREDIQERAVNEEKDYLFDIHIKYTDLQNKYNDAMNVETETVDGDWTSAYTHADEIQKQTKGANILDMIGDVEQQLIAPQTEKLAKIEQESVAPSRTHMEEVMFSLDGRVDKKAYADGMADYDRSLKAAQPDLRSACLSLKKAQMSLYVATKRRMDERGFFSKLFHPKRTKRENDAFAKMRNELKETLGATDQYMDTVDSYIAKKDKYFAELPSVKGRQCLSRVDYSEQIAKQAEAFGKRYLNAELEKAFGPKVEKKDPAVSQPVQAKQVQQTGPKVE